MVSSPSLDGACLSISVYVFQVRIFVYAIGMS